MPPVWPMRADPMNVVFRNGKPRMTIDKTMELVLGVASYNDTYSHFLSPCQVTPLTSRSLMK